MQNAKPIIRVQNVSFSYNDKGYDVLKQINFDIEEGEFVGIIGPNGGGKSTLLRLMLNILPLQKGSIELFDKDIRAFTNWSCIGYVPQKVTQVDNQLPATVWEIVAMGRCVHKGFFRSLQKIDHQMMEQSLADVGMLEYKQTPVHALSGGQQQRVFIARALAGNPCLLVLDEPTTGVDAKAQEEFYALLQQLRKEKKLTIILVSHDINVIASQATSFACLNQTLVYHGKPEEFVRGGYMKKIYGEEVDLIPHGH